MRSRLPPEKENGIIDPRKAAGGEEMEGKKERLDRILVLNHIGSRKEAGKLIRSGQVTVNGQMVRRPEEKADPDRDRICVKGEALPGGRYLYLMMNKPAGVLSAARDPRAQTVVDLLPGRWQRPGIFPAGRLDKDTTGFLVLTDDGEFAHRMLSPKSHVDKVYLAQLDRPVDGEDQRQFAQGMDLGDFVSLPAKMEPAAPDGCTARVTLHEGKFHQVKRMFEKCGKQVVALKRIQIGIVNLDENLAAGEARELTKEERDQLFLHDFC